MEKQKTMESNIADLEVSLGSATEKVTSLDRAKKKVEGELKREL